MDKQYYEAYEGRYQAVQSVSKDLFWGHSPEDEELNAFLSDWVSKNGLKGKNIVEFCCGEGGGAAIIRDMTSRPPPSKKRRIRSKAVRTQRSKCAIL